MKNTFTIILFILLISCKENKAESSKVYSESTIRIVDSDTILYSNLSLDSILLCDKYTYMYGYFAIPDNGCVYQSNASNKIGNVEVYLVPYKKIDIKSYKEEERLLNKLSIDEIKANYKIYIFIIDKKYLGYNKNRDLSYYASVPYKQTIYSYENEKWKEIESLNIVDNDNSAYKITKSKFLKMDSINRNNTSIDLEGDFRIKTTVLAVGSGDPVEVTFYININKTNAVLSIGSENLMETYCEGEYAIQKKYDILILNYIGEGICTSDSDDSKFLIKNENDTLYIKSNRFYPNIWKILERDK